MDKVMVNIWRVEMQEPKNEPVLDFSRFPATLKRLREQKGISRRTLSELCGLQSDQICRYERGQRQPSIWSLFKIADYFCVTLDELLGGKKNGK